MDPSEWHVNSDTGVKGISTNRLPAILIAQKRPLFRKLFPLISVKLTSGKRSPVLRGCSDLFRSPNELPVTLPIVFTSIMLKSWEPGPGCSKLG